MKTRARRCVVHSDHDDAPIDQVVKMNELFDSSRMKHDEQHWDALATRIAMSATSRRAPGNELREFAGSGRGWIAAAVLVAVAAGALLATALRSRVASNEQFSDALEPGDEIGRVITAAAAPPSIGDL